MNTYTNISMKYFSNLLLANEKKLGLKLSKNLCNPEKIHSKDSIFAIAKNGNEISIFEIKDNCELIKKFEFKAKTLDEAYKEAKEVFAEIKKFFNQ